jgi:hypothetical protein
MFLCGSKTQNAWCWVDGDAMIFIAKGFVDPKNEKHGEMPVLLIVTT